VLRLASYTHDNRNRGPAMTATQASHKGTASQNTLICVLAGSLRRV